MQSASPPRRRRRDFDQTRGRILAAARSLVAERGPESLSISEVARRAEIDRTTAYKHFRTRDALVGAVMGALADEIGTMLERPMAFGDLIDHMSRFFIEHPEIGRLTLHHLLAENPFPRAGWDRFVGQLERLAKSSRSQSHIDAEALGHILMAIAVLWPIQLRAVEADTDPGEAAERLAREIKRLLLFGVLRPESWPDLVDSLGVERSE